jgi:hypothetical protein
MEAGLVAEYMKPSFEHSRRGCRCGLPQCSHVCLNSIVETGVDAGPVADLLIQDLTMSRVKTRVESFACVSVMSRVMS